MFRGFLLSDFFTQVCQCEELWKEFKLLFHSHELYVKRLGAFTGVMTRLLTSEANSGGVASPMCMVYIHQSGTILQRSENQVWHQSGQRHLMCWNKDSSEFCSRQSECMVACHTSIGFYESLVCFLVLKYPPSSFIPSLQISKSRAPSPSSAT